MSCSREIAFAKQFEQYRMDGASAPFSCLACCGLAMQVPYAKRNRRTRRQTQLRNGPAVH